MEFIRNVLSIVMCFASIVNARPAANKNSHPEEWRHYPSIDSSGFVPMIPSHDSINPIYAQQNIFHSYFRLNPSTSKPFAVRHANFETTTPFDESLLGSGDFTVMKGGRFYAEGEENSRDYEEEFYDANNRRPYAQPVRQQNPADRFANFKDFADITAGVDTDFSHMVVVYANKNSTKHEPQNILEQLEMIDQETEAETSEQIKSATLSKFKAKLLSAKLKKEFKKFKVPKSDYVDPLEADS